MSSAPSTPLKTVHVLSKKSVSQNRDTYIFWPSKPAILVGGLNQGVTPLTSSNFYRWVRLLDWPSDCELRPVAVKKWHALRWVITPTGPVIPPSNTPLPPGDYGWYSAYPGETYLSIATPFINFKNVESFEEQKRKVGGIPLLKDAIKLYKFPPLFEQSVQQRDRECFITGTSSSQAELGVSWVYPPTWASNLSSESIAEFDYTPYITVSNGILMRKDLMILFHDNAFSVDVDDDYRIVIFKDIGAVTLPSHLPKREHPTNAGPHDKFLQDHFRWTLLVHFPGGDISEDYDHHAIHNAMQSLGVTGWENDLAPMDDRRWNSVLGAAILEQHMRESLAETVGWEGVREQDEEYFDPNRDDYGPPTRYRPLIDDTHPA